MTGPAASVAFVITSCFAPYPPAQRIRELQPLLAKWNIGAPPRHRTVSEEDYCKGLINRLAIRIATVSHARQRLENMDAFVGVGGMPTKQRGPPSALSALGSSLLSRDGPRLDVVSFSPMAGAASPIRETLGGGMFGQLRSRMTSARTKECRSPTAVRWGDDVVDNDRLSLYSGTPASQHRPGGRSAGSVRRGSGAATSNMESTTTSLLIKR
ncbi:hypothetical protein NESM_000918900 [Novymonas esmeraldas]|uniref:Uncharacterized protein n=1 Tax=Novymonas esmeraldas TaxID=1808958 RepID=A0AAW0EZW4_9TRYP